MGKIKPYKVNLKSLLLSNKFIAIFAIFSTPKRMNIENTKIFKQAKPINFNIVPVSPDAMIEDVLVDIPTDIKRDLVLFFPDEGAMKRYSNLATKYGFKCVFASKKRDWSTGEILGLELHGNEGCFLMGRHVLIIDDICSKGGTFYHSAKRLKELGAAEVYLYVSHCENSILQGEVLTSGLIERVFTTDSIFTEKHEKIIIVPPTNS